MLNNIIIIIKLSLQQKYIIYLNENLFSLVMSKKNNLNQFSIKLTQKWCESRRIIVLIKTSKDFRSGKQTIQVSIPNEILK